MLNKLKEFFTPKDIPIDVSRRKFIRDAGALAALTVVATQVPSLLKVKELQEQIASGRVFGQTFYLTEPVVIDLPGVIIEQCYFRSSKPMSCMLHLTDKAEDCIIRDCSFIAHGKLDTVIQVDAQSEGKDMSTTFQSAIDAATGPKGGVIQLSEGTYNFGKPISLPKNTQLTGVDKPAIKYGVNGFRKNKLANAISLG